MEDVEIEEDEDENEDEDEDQKGIPKKDGSGQGIRANRGRGGCDPPEDKSKTIKDLLENRQFYQDSNGKIIEVWSDGSSYELDFDIKNLIGVESTKSVQPATEEYKSSNEREPPTHKKSESAMENKEQNTQDLTEQQYRESYWKETKQYKLDGSTAMMETRISKCMEATGKSREECSKEVKSEMTKKGSENTNTTDSINEEEKEEKEVEVEKEEKKEEKKDTIEKEEIKEETKDNIEICPDELDILKKKAEKYDETVKDLKHMREYIKKSKEKEAKESEKKLVEKIEKFTNDFVVPDEPINKFIEKWKGNNPIDLITDLHEISLLISKKEPETSETIESQDFLTKAEEQWKRIETQLKLT